MTDDELSNKYEEEEQYRKDFPPIGKKDYGNRVMAGLFILLLLAVLGLAAVIVIGVIWLAKVI